MHKTKFKVKGIFFDLDGTLVDSREAYIEATRVAFETMGKKPPESKVALEIARRFEKKQPIDDIIKDDVSKFLNVYLKTYNHASETKTKLIPNTPKTLECLSAKARLVLITMRAVSKKAIIKDLERFNISKYFTYVVTALDPHKPKPSPEALVKCVNALDVEMCDCVIVGDSVNDIRAGKAAGAKTVAVLSGIFSLEELAKEEPDLIIKDTTELPNLLL